MAEFGDWLSHNWGWIFLFCLVFGGGIAEFFTRLLANRKKVAVLRAQNKTLREDLQRSHKLLEAASGGRLMAGDADAVHTAARMARLLDKVQEADTVVPQLSNELRGQIDNELTAYHRPVGIDGPKKGKE